METFKKNRRVVHWVKTSGSTSYKDLQVTASENEWYREWQQLVQQVVKRMTTSENEWKRMTTSVNFG